MAVHELLAAAVAVVTLLAAVDAFYTKRLPKWLRRMVGFYELQESVECINQQTQGIEQDHQEVMDEIQTLKAGQVDIAEVVSDLDGNGLEVDKLRNRHFPDEGDRPGDFQSGDD